MNELCLGGWMRWKGPQCVKWKITSARLRSEITITSQSIGRAFCFSSSSSSSSSVRWEEWQKNTTRATHTHTHTEVINPRGFMLNHSRKLTSVFRVSRRAAEQETARRPRCIVLRSRFGSHADTGAEFSLSSSSFFFFFLEKTRKRATDDSL